ncbi:MAG: TRAP transporter large permease subunit, partial [Pseudomonadota bacterium]
AHSTLDMPKAVIALNGGEGVAAADSAFGMSSVECAIWFGIIVVVVTEISLITPPVGLNLFVINAMAKDVRIGETYRGALPFVISDILRITLLVAFPPITLWLVRLFYG